MFLVVCLSCFRLAYGSGCTENCFSGRVFLMSESGEKLGISISMTLSKSSDQGEIISRITSTKNGGFTTGNKILNIEDGDDLRISVDNPEYFIASPMFGKFFYPKNNTPIELILMYKQSRFYHLFSSKKYYYSVQVATTNSEGNAIDLVGDISRELKGTLPKGVKVSYYPEMLYGLPNNGFFYKVRVGEFDSQDSANKVKRKIKATYKQYQKCFLTTRTKIIDE
jgi:hypothetical protein